MKKILLILLCVPLIGLILYLTSCKQVTKEVHDSFYEVSESIEKSTESLGKGSSDIYEAFENATNQEKVKNHRKLAEEIKPEAEALVDLLQEMKYTLVLAADEKVFLGKHKDEDGKEIEDNSFEVPYSELDDKDKKRTIAFLNAKDDRHSSGDVFNPENKPNLTRIDGEGKATQLKNNILDYKELLLNTLETAKDSNWVTNNGTLSSLIEEINTTLGIEEGYAYGEKGNKRTWEYHNFYDMPAVGVLTILSKWQADIRNMESSVISFLASQVGIQ